MLKPFQVRDLRLPRQIEQLSTHPNFSGIVRISTTDYDEIASNYPRARLTYLDEDEDEDGKETITVSLSCWFSWCQSLMVFFRLDPLSSFPSALRSP
jgi:hypothetical protein